METKSLLKRSLAMTTFAVSSVLSAAEVLDIPVAGDIIGANASHINAGDFDLDGNTEIIALHGDNLYHAELGGDGQLLSLVHTSVQDSDVGVTHRPVFSDLNNDGIVDVLYHGLIYPGVGDGTYATSIAAPFSTCRLGLAMDIDSNGTTDILCAYSYLSNSIVNFSLGEFVNDGYFNLQLKTNHTRENDGYLYFSSAMAQGDINADGVEDIIQLDYARERTTPIGPRDFTLVSAYLGNQNGFDKLAESTTTALHDNEWGTNNIPGLELADMDNDNVLDLVALISSGPAVRNGYVVILRGDGTGQFAEEGSQIDLSADVIPSDLEVVDFNGDGNKDLIVSYLNSSQLNDQLGITVSLGNSDGSFNAPVSIATGRQQVTAITIDDINNDEQSEVLAYSGWEFANIIGVNSVGSGVSASASDNGLTANQPDSVALPVTDSDTVSLEDSSSTMTVSSDNTTSLINSEPATDESTGDDGSIAPETDAPTASTSETNNLVNDNGDVNADPLSSIAQPVSNPETASSGGGTIGLWMLAVLLVTARARRR